MTDPDEPFGPVDEAAAWRSADRSLDEFRRELPRSCLDPLIAMVRTSIERGEPLEVVSANRLTTDQLTANRLTANQLRDLRDELLYRSGFAVVRGFPIDESTPDEIERIFWAVGSALGRPVSQSVMGERLGHVRDVTVADPNARAYRNRSELTPHTDPADLLAFLCIDPASSGGVSRFVSAMAVHEEIRRTRPDLLRRLYRGYRYHRLGEQRPGSEPITSHRLPVFSAHEGTTSCRYVRQYIEVAASEQADIELDDTDREAFDLLESLAADPSFHFEFTLARGEAVFANNFTVLHARTSFHDDPDHPPRHLLRLWLAADPPRPIRPEVLHYDGEPGIAPVPGRKPSYATDVEVQ